MDVLDAALAALSVLASPGHVLALFGGVLLGLVVGILPGLGGTAGLALLLPFLFGMEPSIALAMMIGLQSVTVTSDTFPSVLMGIPGTSGSQATVLDGFPMSKNGEAARALSAAFISSMFGGVFGAVVLSVAIFFAIPLILAIGFGEQLMLVVLALSMVGMLTGASALKGLAACALGLMLGSLGAAPITGEVRMDFGTEYLLDPLPLVIIGLAMFATPEIIDLLRRQDTISRTGRVLGHGWLQGLRDWMANRWLSLRCAGIGCLIGALPGLGGTVIDWIAYGHAVQTTPHRERYGTGDIRGVIAPESANNAKEGGALVPTLLFDIPGSGGMAILLGGFVLIGIQPGPEMITDSLDLVYVIIWSVALANILGAGLCYALSPQIARLTTVRYALLAPFMFGVIFFAAFQSTRAWGDLIALLALSVLGVYMKRFGWPRPALLIGFVLADQVEESVYHTVSVYGLSFLERPIVIGLIVVTLASIFAAVRFKTRPSSMDEHSVHTHRHRGPQLAFYFLVLGFTAWLLLDTVGRDFLTAVYPRFAGVVGLIFLLPIGFALLRGSRPSPVFHDSNRVEAGSALGGKPSELYLALLAGMLLVSAVAGFVIGAAVFIFVFLLTQARASALKSLLYAAGFVLFLGVLSDRLTLRCPPGTSRRRRRTS